MYKFMPLVVLVLLIGIIGFAIKNLPTKNTAVNPQLAEAEKIININDEKILGKKPEPKTITPKNEPKPQLNESSENQLSFNKTNFALPDFSLPNLYEEGFNISKKDLLNKYVVLNFFASWCSTCVAEHATLFALKQQGFVDLYGVAWQDLNENTLKFLQEKGNPYLKVIADGAGEFSKTTNLQAVPETWLVNPKGVVVLRWQGNLQDFAIEELEKYIRAN